MPSSTHTRAHKFNKIITIEMVVAFYLTSNCHAQCFRNLFMHSQWVLHLNLVLIIQIETTNRRTHDTQMFAASIETNKQSKRNKRRHIDAEHRRKRSTVEYSAKWRVRNKISCTHTHQPRHVNIKPFFAPSWRNKQSNERENEKATKHCAHAHARI